MMNITGIIAEYNPFHNGHAYQLELARKETGADYVIVVMSGNFVQRGAPAMLDKYTRTKMALLHGADLVIELPALWSCASAEYFAAAGIALFNQLGCVTDLCYGCETLSGDVFANICDLLNNESARYKSLLAAALKKGSGFAGARQAALLALLPEKDQGAARKILTHPNNILALEYQKALAKTASAVRAHPVARQGKGYHSTQLDTPLASASAIRAYLAGSGRLDDDRLIRNAMPDAAYQLLKDYPEYSSFLYENDCSQLLHYSLLTHAADGFCGFADCTQEISNKIVNRLDHYTGFTDFCMQLKTKDVAYTRISRVFIHILLKIRQEDYAYWRSRSYIPYARVLGFKRQSLTLLGQLKKHASIPLLTRAADARKILATADTRSFYEKNAFADAVYRALILGKSGGASKADTSQRIVIV